MKMYMLSHYDELRRQLGIRYFSEGEKKTVLGVAERIAKDGARKVAVRVFTHEGIRTLRRFSR